MISITPSAYRTHEASCFAVFSWHHVHVRAKTALRCGTLGTAVPATCLPEMPNQQWQCRCRSNAMMVASGRLPCGVARAGEHLVDRSVPGAVMARGQRSAMNTRVKRFTIDKRTVSMHPRRCRPHNPIDRVNSITDMIRIRKQQAYNTYNYPPPSPTTPPAPPPSGLPSHPLDTTFNPTVCVCSCHARVAF